MKKTLLALVLIMAGTLLVNCRPKEKKAEQKAPQAVNEFPNMLLSLVDGTQRSARDLKGKSILIIYFTECDHCQREATEISNRLKAFENYDLWFLSTDAFPSIDKFARDYKLDNHENVHFARIEFQDVATYFGAIPTPSVYIYSESKKLIKAINGETPVDQIIQYL